MSSFGEIIRALEQDAESNGKPATPAGIMRGYWTVPGIYVLTNFRIGQFLLNKGPLGRLLAKLAWLRVIHKSGCHFSYESAIGPGLALPHPTGIVIGSGSRVGRKATLFQNVTLGQKGGAYPELRDGVVVYPGAVLVGGIVVGREAVVGALSFVDRDVADGAAVAGVPAQPIHPAANRVEDR